jgi:dipeptide transport system ATP-binding protein
MSEPVVVARDLVQKYVVGGGAFRTGAELVAVRGVSFSVSAGATLAIVGESGSGKSTIARMVAMVEPPASGELVVDGRVVTPNLARKPDAGLRRSVQLVFQNPYGSLNPRKRVASVLEEPLIVNTGLAAEERRLRVAQALERVGLSAEQGQRYPHMFSGGQRQRIAIARALMLSPKLIVADEPVSALDVSIQAQILNLLQDLQAETSVAYLFISHDLAVVRHIAHEVLVLYLGRAMEQGSKRDVLDHPRHPYTRALLDSTPETTRRRDGRKLVLPAEIPSPFAPPPGCVLNPRCPFAIERCRVEMPVLRSVDGRMVACHRSEEIRGELERGPIATSC